MPVSSAEAVWNGGLQGGDGKMGLGGGAFEGPYSFKTRMQGEGGGTNPEELIAAAHAGCFSMAFSGVLEDAGHPPKSIRTTAHAHFDPTDGGWAISRVELRSEAEVPGIDESEFAEHAEAAKENCPVSQALSVEISLDAQLT